MAKERLIGRPRNADRAPVHVETTVTDREPDRNPIHEKAHIRTRQRRATVNDDQFYIPVEEIPEGSSYEWKRFSVNGLEDPFYIAQMRQQGWEPVDPKRHPTWVPPGYDKPNIIKGGQILMERPIELTREAQAETRTLAKRQMREAEQRLGMTPRDTLTREHPEVAPRITKEMMRPVPIED
jgi:hypothetical protein